MNRTHRLSLLAVGVALLASLVAPPALGHSERDTEFPDGSGEVPEARGDLDQGVAGIAQPHVVVCKPESAQRIAAMPDGPRKEANLQLLSECPEPGHVQPAIDGLTEAGTTIYLLPGTYRERPSRPVPECHASGNLQPYEHHLTCGSDQNLITVAGDDHPGDGERTCDSPRCDLQIEGTGLTREDVVIEGGFRDDGEWLKLNGIRGDRADGLVLKRLTVQLFEFNAIYILETDGYLIDDVLTRWNDEYGILVFANDHGLIKDCEGYNNADSAVYPGSASELNGGEDQAFAGPLGEGGLNRWGTEIRRCNGHHNTLGYSGTAGNSVYVHHNRFHHNVTGIATDSLFPGHPGLPQDHGWFANNDLYSNNVNYYERFIQSGVCDRPPAERGYDPRGLPYEGHEHHDINGNEKIDLHEGAVCPVVPLPVGTGMVIAGGNYNYLQTNRVWDNWRSGFRQFGVPAVLRDETDPAKQFDTSNGNRYDGNVMGLGPDGGDLPNGVDFWWDGQGVGNCWENNSAGDGQITSNTLYLIDGGVYPLGLPDCPNELPLGLFVNPLTQGPIAPCATYNRSDPDYRDPPGCSWLKSPPRPTPRSEANPLAEQVTDLGDDLIAHTW